MAGGNLVFRYDSAFVHQDAPVRQAWDDHYQAVEDGPQMVCLVTGKRGLLRVCTPPLKALSMDRQWAILWSVLMI